MRQWLSQLRNRGNAPSEFATQVFDDAQVGKIVNIACVERFELVNAAVRPAPTSLYGLPADTADFTGRDNDVGELEELLRSGGSRAGVVMISALTGKPGVGKSALAIHVAHRLRDHYPDAQLYVNLRGAEPEPLDPDGVLAEFLKALGVTGDVMPQGVERRAAVYRSHLTGRRALIVLDNAHDERQVRPLLPGSATCAVIVTSRAPLSGLDGVRPRTLDVLDCEAAVELLGKIGGRERISAEPEQASEIVQLCGCLPLAVRIAGGLLAKQPTWTLAKLGRRLRDERRRLDELRLGDLEVRGSFALSYDALDADAARVFGRLTALSGPDFGPGVVAALDESETNATERVLERLADAQLLETRVEDRYRFHDLIRLFALERAERDESPEALELAASRARAWYLQEAQIADAMLRLGRGQAASIDIDDAAPARGHGWLARERANLVAAVEQAHAAQDWQTTQQLAASLTRFLSRWSHWDDWSRTHELALEAARLAADRASEAYMLNSVGVVYGHQGRWEKAIGCHEEALEIWHDLGDHLGEASALGNLGVVHAAQGRWEDAIVCYEHTLERFRAVGDREGEAETLNCFGRVYAGRGPWEEAIGCHEQALEIWRDLGDRLGEASALGNLGGVYARQGRWEEAIGCFQESLKTSAELGDRRGKAGMLGNLGLAYARQGRSGEAIDFYEHSLEVMRELGDRQSEAQMLNNRGVAHGDQGCWEEAIECHEQSLEITRGLGDRAGEARALGNLGRAHGDQGHVKGAIEFYEQCVRITRELGDRHGEAEALTNFGLIYVYQGCLTHALDCYELSLKTMRELGDRDGEARALHGLGLAYGNQGRWEKAMGCFERSLEIQRQLGDRQGEARALIGLGLVLREMGKRGATRHLRDAVRIVNSLQVDVVRADRESVRLPWRRRPRAR
jgi:tetratricopeptide (TPR) repeat protein